MDHVPVFQEPLSIPPEEYGKKITDHANESRRYTVDLLSKMRLIEYMVDEIAWLDDGARIDVGILTTGSDGRLEKATFIPGKMNGNGHNKITKDHHGVEVPSKMDLQVLLSIPPEMAHLRTAIIQRVREIMGENLDDLQLFESTFEVKDTYAVSTSGLDDGRENPWPTRVLDAATLVATKEPTGSASLRPLLLKELAADPKRLETLRDREANRMKDFRHVCVGRDYEGVKIPIGTQHHSQKVGTVKHFDLEEGVSYYDREKHIGSFKFGPLRLVQFSVASRVLQLLQYPARRDFLHTMPHPTAGKLVALAEQRALPQAIQKRLGQNYLFFLQQYHQSEWNYAKSGDHSFAFAPTPAARSEVRERLSDTAADVKFLQGPLPK